MAQTMIKAFWDTTNRLDSRDRLLSRRVNRATITTRCLRHPSRRSTARRDDAMSGDFTLQTPLHGWHQAHGGRLVEFGGWSMPVQYTTIVEEHQAVRERVGLFDISHMGRLTFDGPDALTWLERVTTNHVARLAVRPDPVQPDGQRAAAA